MRKLIITSITLLITFFSFSQEIKKDTLKTEEISVVKPYTPVISDAFKVTSNPKTDVANAFKKENITYTIFSIPVASTFTPSKGKVQGVTRAPKERLFQNYISAGFGNFTTPLFEAYIHAGDIRHHDFGVFINHHSSEGGLNNVILNTNFSNTYIETYYKQFDRDYNWQINAGVQRKQYNYYGLSNNVIYDDVFINSLNEEQVYKNSSISGKINVIDSFFKEATATLVNFTDEYNSNEVRFLLKPTVELPISTELINANFVLDFISGKFDQNMSSTTELKHRFLNLGFLPNFEVLRENLTLNLGVKLYYTNNLELKENNFYAYPNVTASLKMIDEVLTLVAGVTGDLKQNTYANFATENPYISPTLTILQTDNQYTAFAGIKGKLASNINYTFQTSHTSEIDKPLFIQNQTKTNGTLLIDMAYQAGNSFNIVYDNVKTLDFLAEIIIEASEEFEFSGSLNYSSFTTDTQIKAWNLPTISGNLTANYQSKSWFAGANLFYKGETNDFVIPFGLTAENGEIVKNNSYLDLNLNGGYIFSDRLTAFAKVNNALGTKYEPFVNYQIQPLQILAGITYKFDL
jgi:hypothetical protein